MQLMIWKLLTGIVCAGVIALGSVALVGALMAIASLREWQREHRDIW